MCELGSIMNLLLIMKSQMNARKFSAGCGVADYHRKNLSTVLKF